MTSKGRKKSGDIRYPPLVNGEYIFKWCDIDPEAAHAFDLSVRRVSLNTLVLSPKGKPNYADDTTNPSFKSKVNTFLTSEGHRPIGEDVEGWDGPFVPTTKGNP